MKEGIKNQPIIKADIPARFFIIRILLVIIVFVLILFKIQYEFILLYLICILPFILNLDCAIIEVYQDCFKIIRIGAFYKNFKKEETFNYKFIKEFEYEKSKFNLVLGILSIFLPTKGAGSNYIYKLPSMIFNYHEAEAAYKVSSKFSYSTNKLIRSFELIQEKVKHQAHK